MKMSNRTWHERTALLSLALAAGVAHGAEPANSERSSDSIDEVVTVVGTRTPRSIDQVGATVSVISTEELQRQITRDIADLVRFEPGVSVAGTGSRFGLSGFNIRGIDGNRVLTVVDGVRVPDEFSFGPFLSSRRDFVDVDNLEVVEIARGPISSLYGSDALGGVVSFTTRRPSSYVSNEKPFYGSVNLGYSGDDSSTNGSTTLAAGNDQIAAMVSYTRRDGSETETAGRSGFLTQARQEADPQDIELDNLALKLEYSPSDQHRFLLAYESYDQSADSAILSDYGLVLGGFGPPTTVDTRDANDSRERKRWSVDYRYSNEEGWVNGVAVKLYHQRGLTEQLTNETRTAVSGPQTRFRFSEFDQEIDGAYLQLTSQFSTGPAAHTLIYGVDYFKTDNESLRNGGTFDAAGNSLFEFNPFPTRDFPLTKVEQLAYFVQDEIVLFDDKLRLTPGLRYDQFDANATADAVYLTGNPGSPSPEDYDDSELTVSLSAVYQFSENWSGFARYSEGFRAPPYDDVNIGFTNPLGGYKTIANPELESETSQGFEVGVRWGHARGNMSLAVFRNDYDDFIDPLSIAPAFLPFGGRDPADGFLTFQSVNRAKVEIEGIELNGLVQLDGLAGWLDGVALRYALAWASGDDVEADEPLDTVNPLTGVFGVVYDAPNGRYGGQLLLTAVKGKSESDISSASDRIATSGYGILDLLAYVDLTERMTLNVGLFNLTDRTYLRWADTVSIGADAPERFTQPGFNAGATLRVEF